jgi:hypothetical protein
MSIIYKNHPDLGFGSPSPLKTNQFNVSALTYVNTGFGSPGKAEINNVEYVNLIDAKFGSPYFEYVWSNLARSRNQTVEYTTLIESGSVYINKESILQISYKNKKFTNPFISCSFPGKNTVLSLQNIDNNSFTVINCTKHEGYVNYIASETIQQLNNIDTDLDTFSDLFELIEGTNPLIKYI